jgi:signal transduction histidine kinase
VTISRGFGYRVTDAILVVDKYLNTIWSNPIAEDFFGPDLVGEKCCDIFNFCSKSCSPCSVKKCFEDVRNYEHEIEIIGANGARMDLWCTASVATRAEDGTPKTVILVYRDVTEKKLLQAETARAGQLASIGELAAGVAHEINNPINGIINCAQMLIDGDGATKDQTEISQRILEAGGRIAMIVRNLLSFDRNREEEPDHVHIQGILSDSLDLAETQLRNDSIDLRVDIQDNIPRIKVRGHQIQQVFLNIISNARYALNQKFSRAHENKIIEIKAETVDTHGKKYVRVIFFDQGTGISADIIDRICDPFFSNKPHGEGTGLGLSISQAIIKDHGGNLYFDSVDAEYAKVLIELPVELMNPRT